MTNNLLMILLRKIVVRVFLVSVSLLVTLVILEVGIRLFIPQQLILIRPDIYVPDDGFGWRHAPNLNTTVNTGERKVRFFTDKNGYRIGSTELKPAATSYRILALGDSFLEALQVKYEQTMTAHIEQTLTTELGSTTVINTGVAGWEPNHYLLQAKYELNRNEYDLMIVFIYIQNDVQHREINTFPPRPKLKYDFHLPQHLTKAEFKYRVFYPINNFFETHSHLYILLKRNFELTLAKEGLTAKYFPDVYFRTSVDSPRWAVTADICGNIAEEGNRHGVPSVFVLLPAMYQVEEEQFEWYQEAFALDPELIDLNQPNRLLRAEFEARGLIVLDATDVLKMAHQSGVNDLYGKIDTHFGYGGHKVAAKLLTDWLLESDKLN